MSGAEDRELESLELDLLLEALARRYGNDFRQYARPSLQRRAQEAMRDEGVTSLSVLQDRLLRDEECAARVVSKFTVHTTSMFRDPGFFQMFRTQVVPLLRTYPFIRIWHAGCSTGEEVYSMAILLQEEGLYDRCRVYASDVSVKHLEHARGGIYPLASMRANTARYVRAGGRAEFSSYYTTDAEHAAFRRSLVQNVTFSQHDLVSGGSFNEFHVILCRNVLIYFDRDLRERVLKLFCESLVRFGVLALGQRETIRFTGCESSFAELNEDERIYRRVD